MKVLSVRPFWAKAIMELGKNIENREWSTRYRGLLAIHASGRRETGAEYEEFIEYAGTECARDVGLGRCNDRMRQFRHTPIVAGAIIGTVELVDVRANHGGRTPPWAEDSDYHWVLKNPRPCVPRPCLGKLRLWECPDEWVVSL